MDKSHLEAYTWKISNPKQLNIEYKSFDKKRTGDDTELNKYVSLYVFKM